MINITFDDYRSRSKHVIVGKDSNEHQYSVMYRFKMNRQDAKEKVLLYFYRKILNHDKVQEEKKIGDEILNICEETVNSYDTGKYSIKGDVCSFRGAVIEYYEQWGVGEGGRYYVITGFVGALNKKIHYVGLMPFTWLIQKLFIKRGMREKLITIDDSKKINVKLSPKSNPAIDRLKAMGLYQDKDKWYYRFIKLF